MMTYSDNCGIKWVIIEKWHIYPFFLIFPNFQDEIAFFSISALDFYESLISLADISVWIFVQAWIGNLYFSSLFIVQSLKIFRHKMRVSTRPAVRRTHMPEPKGEIRRRATQGPFSTRKPQTRKTMRNRFSKLREKQTATQRSPAKVTKRNDWLFEQ